MNDYLLEMLEMLTGGYNREDVQNVRHGRTPVTNIGKLFSIPAWGLRLVHDHAEKVRLWDNLDYAQGNALDRYGANFGIDREGLDDDYFRLLIKVKMIAQISGGDIDTLIDATATLLGIATDDIDLKELFPAKIWIYMDQDLLDEYHLEIIDLIARVMKRIVAAGVGMKLILRTYHTSRKPLYLNTAACETVDLTLPPVNVPRVSTQTLYINCAAYETVEITLRPAIQKEDR